MFARIFQYASTRFCITLFGIDYSILVKDLLKIFSVSQPDQNNSSLVSYGSNDNSLDTLSFIDTWHSEKKGRHSISRTRQNKASLEGKEDWEPLIVDQSQLISETSIIMYRPRKNWNLAPLKKRYRTKTLVDTRYLSLFHSLNKTKYMSQLKYQW